MMNWREFIPIPICDAHPEYYELYMKAWELAYAHIKDKQGMPQTPYMDEAFCETQVWIWDSCFMALFCKFARQIFPGVETLNNFYEVLYEGKQLPETIPPENEPEWTGAVPGVPYNIKVHIADNPPLFAWAEYENALMSGDYGYVQELLYEKQYLQKHYEWIEGLHQHTNVEGVLHFTWLRAEQNGYKWEGGCSGMDNTPRGRIGEHAEGPRPNNPDMLWLDAICQQALSALMISRLYEIVGDVNQQQEWHKRYDEKKSIINRLYWDERDKFYYDIDCNSHSFYRVMTIASYWAMTAEVTSQEQATCLVEQLLNEETLGGFVPFVSLSRNDADYNPEGRYWRGSVWLPTAYAALKGLENYGKLKEAHDMSRVLLNHMYRTYKDFTPHTIWECYSPTEYKPATNEDGNEKYVRPDFCGWSALGPIAVYIEFVLGFHKINAFERVVEWEKPSTFSGKLGIKHLRFGNIVTDIEYDGEKYIVISNGEYTLKICGEEYRIHSGRNEF